MKKPTATRISTTVLSIAAGAASTCPSTGAVTCWGTIFLGGGNTPSYSDVPVEAMGL